MLLQPHQPDPAAAANVRAWGRELGDASAQLQPQRHRVRELDEPLDLVPVDESTVRTVGWELRNAMLQGVDDGLCVARATFAAHAVAQRALGGDLDAAAANLASEDSRAGALLVAHNPRITASSGRVTHHAAPLFRTPAGDLLVIDHLVSPSPDGVIAASDWLSRISARPAFATVSSAMAELSLRRPSSGLGVSEAQLERSDWQRMSEDLAGSLERHATRGDDAARGSSRTSSPAPQSG